jgi:hypothetical protein
MWFWRRTERIIWTDCVRNKVLVSRKKGRSYKQYKEGRLSRLILSRNCLLRHVMEGKIKVMGRRGRRHRQLLDILKETEGTVY